jgi:hypothetical protein
MYSINSVVASGSVCSCVLLGKRKKERKKERKAATNGGWLGERKGAMWEERTSAALAADGPIATAAYIRC